MIEITKLKTLPEQVLQNTKDISSMTDSVDDATTKADEASAKADSAMTEAQSAHAAAIKAGLSATVAQTTADKAITNLNQCWEKEFKNVTISPDDFQTDLTVTLEDEIFKQANVITIAPTADNDTTVKDNAKNISYYNLRPLQQTEDGKIVLKTDELPSVDLYLTIQIEVQLNIE